MPAVHPTFWARLLRPRAMPPSTAVLDLRRFVDVEKTLEGNPRTCRLQDKLSGTPAWVAIRRKHVRQRPSLLPQRLRQIGERATLDPISHPACKFHMSFYLYHVALLRRRVLDGWAFATYTCTPRAVMQSRHADPQYLVQSRQRPYPLFRWVLARKELFL